MYNPRPYVPQLYNPLYGITSFPPQLHLLYGMIRELWWLTHYT